MTVKKIVTNYSLVKDIRLYVSEYEFYLIPPHCSLIMTVTERTEHFHLFNEFTLELNPIGLESEGEAA